MSTPPPLEPSKSLDSVDRDGLSVVVCPSPEFVGQMVTVGDEVVASRASTPIPGALFAKKLCDFLVRLEADDPGFGKTIGCLLKERKIKRKGKKVGSCKEKSTKGKNKKLAASRKAPG